MASIVSIPPFINRYLASKTSTDYALTYVPTLTRGYTFGIFPISDVIVADFNLRVDMAVSSYIKCNEPDEEPEPSDLYLSELVSARDNLAKQCAELADFDDTRISDGSGEACSIEMQCSVMRDEIAALDREIAAYKSAEQAIANWPPNDDDIEIYDLFDFTDIPF